jgi:predicted CoA-binding protein
MMRKLLGEGYRVIPVNPNQDAVLGQLTYPTLEAVPVPIDIVDVFRRAEHTPAVADAAIAARARVLWLQSGIVNEEAAARARKAGLVVVMDLCIGVMHALLQVPRRG